MNAAVHVRCLTLMGVFTLAGCMTNTPPPPNLDLSSLRTTTHKTYTVQIDPLESPLAVNKMHAWQVVVKGKGGEAVSHAKIGVGGGMPQHGHGFPTQPKVTKELGDGRYLLEGMKFSMPGWWEIKLDINAAEGTDQVTFNTVVPVNAGMP